MPATDDILIDLAISNWRFLRLFERVLHKLDAGESQRYAGQALFLKRSVENALESAGLKVVDVEGQVFEPGIPVTPLNISDFGSDDQLLVDKMIEPILMGPDGLRRQGTVILRKAEQ